MEKNYWMFRVSNKWGNRTKFCFENNLIHCGWNIGLSKDSKKDILEKYPSASRMAIKFTYIKEGDIVVMPVTGGIAFGVAKEKVFRPDLDWQDTINVDWLTNWYSRKNLSSKLQGSLKYRGTFLNLNRYRIELEELIKNKFDSIDRVYQNQKQINYQNSIERISKHLNSRTNLKFQDREFEYFIPE